MLDTARVDSESTFSTLVSAFGLAGDRICVKPEYSDSLCTYENGRYTGSIPIDGRSDFVFVDSTLYSLSFRYRSAEIYAEIHIQSPDTTVELEVPADVMPAQGYSDRLVRIDTSVDLVDFSTGRSLRLSPSLAPTVAATDLSIGVLSQHGRVHQDVLDIVRDGVPVLTMSFAERGDLVWVFDSGGFVIQRDWRTTEGAGSQFDVYSGTIPAKLVRSVQTLPLMHPFNLDHPVLFTAEYIYQMVLAADEATVVRY